jgi:hypothetical protein
MKNTNATRKSKAKELSLIDLRSKRGSICTNKTLKRDRVRVKIKAYADAFICHYTDAKPSVCALSARLGKLQRLIPKRLGLFAIRKRSIAIRLLDLAYDGPLSSAGIFVRILLG